MKHLEEMEQLKKEYQEIPVPEHGIDGVKAAIEKARQKKRLRKRLISYSSMAAAVVLALFVGPQMTLRMFSGGSSNEAASMGYESMVKDMFDNALKSEAESDAVQEPWCDGAGGAENYGGSGEVAPGWFPEAPKKKEAWLAAFPDEAVRKKIEAEMTRQIQSRSLAGEEAMVMLSASSQFLDFEEKAAEHHLDENGQLVIVFLAGELVPEKYGEIKFIIPDEVWK